MKCKNCIKKDKEIEELKSAIKEYEETRDKVIKMCEEALKKH